MTKLNRNTVAHPELVFMIGWLHSAYTFTFLSSLFSNVGAVMSVLTSRFVASLHETRRQQAIRIIRDNRESMQIQHL